MNEVASNNGFAVSSDRGEFSHRRDLSEHRRKLAFFSRVFGMFGRLQERLQEQESSSGGRTMGIEKKVSNYGVESNYGVNYGVATEDGSAPDNYGNYGVSNYGNYGDSNYGNYGIRRHRRRVR